MEQFKQEILVQSMARCVEAATKAKGFGSKY